MDDLNFCTSSTSQGKKPHILRRYLVNFLLGVSAMGCGESGNKMKVDKVTIKTR